MAHDGYKRLKVRLRSEDRETLAEDLGAHLHESGLFLPSAKLLPPGTRVHLHLMYSDGRPALTGEGHVTQVTQQPPGMQLELQWEPSCRPVLYWAITRAQNPTWNVHAALQSTPQVSSDLAVISAAMELPLASASLPAAAPSNSGQWAGLIPPVPRLDSAPVAPAVPAELSFEAPIEEDGTPSEDLLPPAEALMTEASEDIEPILLEDVVEEPPELPSEPPPASSGSTQYAFSRGARDELGPGPAPADALASPVLPARAAPTPAADREPGEVTPLARIELVRRSRSMVRAGELAPPPLEAVQRVPPSAIPNKQHRVPLAPPSRRALGIDPGHAVSRAAIVERGDARIVPGRGGGQGVPSAVLIEPSGRTIVGEPAQRRLPWHPDSGIHGTKRLLGRLYCSPRVDSLKARLLCSIGAAEEDEVALSVGEHFISLEEIEALVLKEVKAGAALSLQDEINRAVLTCPASYGIRQRRAIAMAGELAGLHVERVLSAPLAVVFAQLKRGQLAAGRYLVYDLGASVFDAAVVQVQSQSARVLAAGGDPELAGVEFDHALAEDVFGQLEALHGADMLSQFALQDVVDLCEVAKCELSTQASTRIVVEQKSVGQAPAFATEIEVLREAAERRFEPLVERTLQIVHELLSRSATQLDDLTGVLLVGGQSQTPLVKQKLQALFGDRVLDLDPLTAAAEGAAWAANELESTAPFGLHEPLYESLGLGIEGGRVQPVLTSGAVLPSAGRGHVDVRRPEDLHVFLFQGDRGHVERDEPVAHVLLEAPEGTELPWRVALDVEVSSLGDLTYSAHDPENGAAVGVREIKELSREQLRAHFGHAAAVPVPTPPHGLFERLIRAFKPKDGPYN